MKKIKVFPVLMVCLALALSCDDGSDDGGEEPFLVMVRITGGEFTMGSPLTEEYRRPIFEIKDDETGEPTGEEIDEEAQWQVTLSDFYIGKYEITQKQYKTVMGHNPSYWSIDRELDEDGQPIETPRPPAAGEIADRRPVERVKWYEAIVFCNKLSISEGLTPAYSITIYDQDEEKSFTLIDPDEWGSVPRDNTTEWDTVKIVEGSDGYRLPTEAQWEYACRAGTTTPWHSGGTSATLDGYAWYVQNSNTSGEFMTHQVGKKKANARGLHDMHGNVAEWCWDRSVYETEKPTPPYPTSPQTDPEGESTGDTRRVRGGYYYSGGEDMRSAARSGAFPYGLGMSTGFRVARPAP